MDAEKIVLDFCKAIADRDVDRLVAFFSDEAVYHNIPVAPVSGPEAIGKVLTGYLGSASEAEFEVVAIASRGQTVLTERIDRFTIGDKRIVLPVMGAFEIGSDGRITAWRDYFDMNQFTSQMA